MKKIVLLLVLVSIAFAAQAQWSLLPEVGMTAFKRIEDGSQKWESGWKAGVGVEYRFKGVMGVKSGLYYTQRGYILDSYMSLAPNQTEIKDIQTGESLFGEKPFLQFSTGSTQRHFLQLPLMAQVRIPLAEDVKLNIAVGPYLAYCLSSNNTYRMTTLMDRGEGYGGPNSGQWGNPPDFGFEGYHKSDEYGVYSPFSGISRWDWGGTAEIGLEIKNFYLKTSYELSLSKEHKEDKVKPNYHTFTMAFGYKFKL